MSLLVFVVQIPVHRFFLVSVSGTYSVLHSTKSAADFSCAQVFVLQSCCLGILFRVDFSGSPQWPGR
jgi:hypothetical protein